MNPNDRIRKDSSFIGQAILIIVMLLCIIGVWLWAYNQPVYGPNVPPAPIVAPPEPIVVPPAPIVVPVPTPEPEPVIIPPGPEPRCERKTNA